MGGFEWQVSPEQAFANIEEQYMAMVKSGVEAVALRWAPDIESWMKQNAGWIDRTGNARQTLHVEVVVLAEEIAMILAHGMDYGISLELSYGGKYAIIGPALEEFAPKVLADVRSMMGQ